MRHTQGFQGAFIAEQFYVLHLVVLRFCSHAGIRIFYLGAT